MTVGVLDHISSPTDVKALGLRELRALAEEVREEIKRTMAANGGHLATNLGTVELSLALHWAFDSPHDKILWDVGNQCYTHKIVTGRRDRFHTIRKEGGLSGFVNRQESVHDHMTAGHAGTALSSALGIAAARDCLGHDYRVAAVAGDGAFTAGLSYEALNNLGAFKSQLLVILNDNDFSIAQTCGALTHALEGAKSRILDGTIFEQLGITYLGPVDGHDLQLLTDVFHEVKQIDRPVVLHVLTQKGKGYSLAEEDPERFHGVSPFDLETGKSLRSGGMPTYSELFGHEMVSLAEADHRIVAITAAMRTATGLTEFARRWPERFFDVGIAEQHAVTFAAGLAVAGCRPVAAIYSSFLQRSYDQVVHDVCLQDLPVTFVLDRAGIVGGDGPTHHGVLDYGYLRILPRMVVMAPKDGEEFSSMLRVAVAFDGPVSIRVPRGAVPPPLERTHTSPVEIGKGEVLQDGDDVALIAIGSMVREAVDAAELLEKRGISAAVVNARFVKPLDTELITATARRVKRVFTLEEHAELGGFGSAVTELLSQHRVPTPVTILGLPDRFIEHGSAKRLLDECGLSTEKIAARVVTEMREGDAGTIMKAVETDSSLVQEVIQRIRDTTLPDELDFWVREYANVGHRGAFLWKWCLEGVRLTSLSSVDPTLRDANNVTKVLGVMFDVLVDDVADASGTTSFLERLLEIPFATVPPELSVLPADQRNYADTTHRVWEAIIHRARSYPRYEEFAELLRFDYTQLLNTMRYSHMVNRDPRLLNLAEHDLYLPHNMHMMVSGTLDLMCSPGFDTAELGHLREVLWHAQCMGRIGNLVTTWERELGDSDVTSGVFARAVQLGALTPDDLAHADRERIRETIISHGCETYFLERWHVHRQQIKARATTIRAVDVGHLLTGLERLFTIHMGSRGLK